MFYFETDYQCCVYAKQIIAVVFQQEQIIMVVVVYTNTLLWHVFLSETERTLLAIYTGRLKALVL